MAVTTRQILMQSRVLGGGFDTSGNPKQGKDFVVGRLLGTYASAGVAVSAADLGLSTVDYVTFQVTNPAPSAAVDNEQAFYDGTTLFIRNQDDGATLGDVAFTVQFLAVGDAQRDVELL